MKQAAENAIRTIFSLTGLNVEKSTDKDSIVTLIGKLHPFLTDKELIRVGTNGDGGYLIPDDLEGISACFSPGVGSKSSFEEECLKYGMQVFMADNSVDSPAVKNDQLHFIKKNIGMISNDDFITMDDWVKSSLENRNSELLLQMDIESYEYPSIISMSNALLSRFRIIVIEFHKLHKLWNKEFYSLASAVFQKLLQTHTCVHIHPNNYGGIEKLSGIEIPRLAELFLIN
jgi:hypothetical protein